MTTTVATMEADMRTEERRHQDRATEAEDVEGRRAVDRGLWDRRRRCGVDLEV